MDWREKIRILFAFALLLFIAFTLEYIIGLFGDSITYLQVVGTTLSVMMLYVFWEISTPLQGAKRKK